MKKTIRTNITLSIAFTLSAFSAISCSNNSNVVVESDADIAVESPVASIDAIPSDIPVSENTPSTDKSDAVNASFNVSDPEVLFNGKDLDGWTGETGEAPKGWEVKDGVLCLTDPQNGGDIVTKEKFDNYVFTFEWRFGKECNSGVKYKIEQPNGKGWIGLEYQVQDDEHVEDGKVANRKIASLFDVLAAAPSSKAGDYPAPTEDAPCGEFRSGKIVVAGNHVEHWIDGEKVLSFEIGSDEWKSALADSKFKNQKNFGLTQTSPLLLQCHGYPVEYRNLTIQKLASKTND